MAFTTETANVVSFCFVGVCAMVKIAIANADLDRAALHDMMIEFYTLQIGRANAEIAAALTPEIATQDFWDGYDDYFAPNGVLVLAHGDDNALIGMGMMRKIRPDTAEFKRMYVRPAGRGHGIGRKMIEMRIDAARIMGLRTIVADTLKASTTMHGIYRDMGFRQIDRYPESHTAIHYPQAAPDLIYFQLDL